VSWLTTEVLTWLLVPAGVITGMVNVVAGGGSFLSLPLLLAIGLPADVANGTNRVAIIVQAFVAGGAYRSEGKLDWRLFRRLLPPLFVGAIGGALLATWMDPTKLSFTFGVLFLATGTWLLWRDVFSAKGKEKALESQPEQPRASIPGRAWKEPALLFLLGIYGGFLQAGVALFVLLVCVRLFGESALRMNAIKLPLVMTFTVPSFLIFIGAGQVAWWPGLLLAGGSVVGSLLGVRLTMSRGPTFIMRAAMIVLLVTGVALVWP
jgi:uncharacterized membrane protein YfcA